jgi:hypothetical protein
VRYRCVSAAHRALRGDSGTMTIHEKSWAFCDADEPRGEHVWERRDQTLTELRQERLLAGKSTISIGTSVRLEPAAKPGGVARNRTPGAS